MFILLLTHSARSFVRPLLRTATAQACKIGKNPYFEGPDRLNRRGGAVMLISAVWTILSSDDLSKNIRVKIQEVTSSPGCSTHAIAPKRH